MSCDLKTLNMGLKNAFKVLSNSSLLSKIVVSYTNLYGFQQDLTTFPGKLDPFHCVDYMT